MTHDGSAHNGSPGHPSPRPSGRARGPYKSGVRRREQILDTAVQAFGQHGYAGASLRRIAEQVGITPAAVVRHFGSKEGLFTAVLERSDRTNAAALTAETNGLAHLSQLAGVLRTNVAHRGLVELLLTVAAEASDPEHPARPFVEQRYARLVDRLTTELTRAAEAGEIAPLSPWQARAEAHGFVALLDGLQLQWLLDPSMDLLAVHEHLLNATVQRWRAQSSVAGS